MGLLHKDLILTGARCGGAATGPATAYSVAWAGSHTPLLAPHVWLTTPIDSGGPVTPLIDDRRLLTAESILFRAHDGGRDDGQNQDRRPLLDYLHALLGSVGQ